MKSHGIKPVLFAQKGGELPLSGATLGELLRTVLSRGASFRFRAKGFSMSPFIKDGDIITVSPLSEVSFCVGDILAFIHPTRGGLLVHRVVGKKKGYYLMKGDNIPETDGLVPVANIQGYVKSVEREGKRVFLGLGPERFLIAFLTRRVSLSTLAFPVSRLLRPIIRRTVR